MTKHVYRDAGTGEFVGKDYAKANPSTTVREELADDEKVISEKWQSTTSGSLTFTAIESTDGIVKIHVEQLRALLSRAGFTPVEGNKADGLTLERSGD